jgi:hypothetical protein
MTYKGHVQNGVIVLDEPTDLPDGAEVRVELAERETERSLADRLRNVIGVAKTLPEDISEQHDHYLHGRPKK